MSEYLYRTDLINGEDNFIISRPAKTKNGNNGHGEKPLADSTVRELFNRDIALLCNNIEPALTFFHSLRSGGSSTASKNRISERLIGKHGRWKSGYSRARYLKDSKRIRLGVTEKLGL